MTLALGCGIELVSALRINAHLGRSLWRAARCLPLAGVWVAALRNLLLVRGEFSVAVENPPPAKNCVARQLRTSTTDMRLSKMPVESATSAAMMATVMTARITPYSAMV